MTSRRSLLVSWILGAVVVGLVTFSFEALSARETAPNRCPVTGVTGATAATGSPRSAVCPVQPTVPRCPATGATATPAAPSGRCPAGGKALESIRAGSVV